MRKAFRASVLVMALAIPAFAGDIPYDVRATGNITNNVTVMGDIPYDLTLLNLLTLILL
jgi:hypothetical protein